MKAETREDIAERIFCDLGNAISDFDYQGVDKDEIIKIIANRLYDYVIVSGNLVE